eukprot:754149-Hanusia_phi.AAC.1
MWTSWAAARRALASKSSAALLHVFNDTVLFLFMLACSSAAASVRWCESTSSRRARTPPWEQGEEAACGANTNLHEDLVLAQLVQGRVRTESIQDPPALLPRLFQALDVIPAHEHAVAGGEVQEGGPRRIASLRDLDRSIHARASQLMVHHPPMQQQRCLDSVGFDAADEGRAGLGEGLHELLQLLAELGGHADVLGGLRAQLTPHLA